MSHASTARYDIAEPYADSLIQSLRAIGYDLPSAIADLVDNSITAEARSVRLDFQWNGEHSTIAVLDDGTGMSESDLIDAMRLGSRNPLAERKRTDLGRFGLGLKTASFSQCRCLTVATKSKGGPVVIRCWDLDYVSEHREWRLLRESSSGLTPYLDELRGQPSGTIVLWENADRLVGGTNVNDPRHHKAFLAAAARVREHLAMVFHRFLEGPKPLKLFINEEPIKPWNPFLPGHVATQELTDEALALFEDRVKVKPYVLPHHSKLDDQTYREMAGPKGWVAQQGFYVYRNRRLLVAGDWLGLGWQKEEHFKLARIMIDIPNSMDSEWEIDVKKSRAYPPLQLQERLRQLGEITRKHASDIYRFRGARLNKGLVRLQFLWDKVVLHGKVGYAINREHPLVKSVLEGTSGEAHRRFMALLELIEQTVPVPTIAIDHAESPEAHGKPFEHVPQKLKTVLYEVYQALRATGVSPEDAKLRLLALEPFNEHPELVAALED